VKTRPKPGLASSRSRSSAGKRFFARLTWKVKAEALYLLARAAEAEPRHSPGARQVRDEGALQQSLRVDREIRGEYAHRATGVAKVPPLRAAEGMPPQCAQRHGDAEGQRGVQRDQGKVRILYRPRDLHFGMPDREVRHGGHEMHHVAQRGKLDEQDSRRGHGAF